MSAAGTTCACASSSSSRSRCSLSRELHERVPSRLHGRAYAAYNGLRNAAELFAMAAGGVLVVAIGARWTLFLAGAIPAFAGLAGIAVYSRFREREIPVAVTQPADNT